MNAWVSLHDIYVLIGLLVLGLAVLTLRDRSHPRRLSTALFWGLFGAIFLLGDAAVASLGKPLAHRMVGAAVLLMAGIAGAGWLGAGRHEARPLVQRQASAARLGQRLFVPALLIPMLTVAFSLALKGLSVAGRLLLDPKQLTLCALALAVLCALALACRLTRDTPLQALRESRRLLDTIGWAAVLPQMLAMLGGVFVAAHTGEAVQGLVKLFLTPDNRLLLVAAYCVGMALFTMVMGNAFAAFPVMTAGIALPFLIHGQHADPAPVVTIGMLAGYCGTLMTPMAANFNIVPAALLELRDRHLVIKTQFATAIPLLIVNIVLMDMLAFR